MRDLLEGLNSAINLYKDEKVWEAHVLLQKLIRKHGFKSVCKANPICMEIQRRAAIIKKFVNVLNELDIEEVAVSSKFYINDESCAGDLVAERERNAVPSNEEFFSPDESDSFKSIISSNEDNNVDSDTAIEDPYFDENGNLLSSVVMENCASLVTNTRPKEWVCVTEKGLFDLWYRGYEDSTIIEICFQGNISTSIFNVLSVFYERDLYKDWIPYFSFPVKFGLNSIREIIHRDRVHIVTAIYIDIPWPFKNREVILEIWVSDEITPNNRIFIYASSIEDHGFHPRLKAEIPYLLEYSSRANISGGGFVSPVDDDSTNILFMWKIDLFIDPPKFLLNFFLKIFVKACWDKFCKTCIRADDPSSVHRRRISENKSLYDFIRERISARNYKEKGQAQFTDS